MVSSSWCANPRFRIPHRTLSEFHSTIDSICPYNLYEPLRQFQVNDKFSSVGTKSHDRWPITEVVLCLSILAQECSSMNEQLHHCMSNYKPGSWDEHSVGCEKTIVIFPSQLETRREASTMVYVCPVVNYQGQRCGSSLPRPWVLCEDRFHDLSELRPKLCFETPHFCSISWAHSFSFHLCKSLVSLYTA